MSNTYEGSKDSVQPIKFGKDRREKLVNYLKTEIEQALTDREGDVQKWKVWVKQANSRLKREDARARDSKLDMTLTRERMFQNGARLQTPIFQQDTIMATKPRRARADKLAKELEYVLDYICDRADMMMLSDEWVEQFQMFPYGVVKTPFVTEVSNIKRWQEIGIDEYLANQQIKTTGMIKRETESGTRYFIEVEKKQIAKQSAAPEVISVEDFIFPAGSSGIYSAPWVTHRVWLTKSDVKFRIKEGIYDEKDDLKIPILQILGKPNSERERVLDAYKEEDEQQTKSSKQYEIMETYLQFDVEGNGEDSEIIVTWERKSGVILRAIHNFYHAYYRPFVVHQYRPVHGSLCGTSLTFMLEPLHRAYSASINQRLDAGSLANEVALMVPPGHPLLKVAERDGFRGGVYENTAGKEEVFDVRLSEPSFRQLESLEGVFETRADRISHLSEYSFGDEQIQRPTATGQTQIIEESKQPQYLQLERYRKSFAEVVKHMLARYRQFFPEGMEYYVKSLEMDEIEGQEKMQLIQQFFEWPEQNIEDEVLIETSVSSATMSKKLRKEEMVALMDKMPSVYQMMMSLSSAAVDVMNPSAMMAAKLLNGYQKVVDKFMVEFEVSDKEQLNPSLIDEVQVAQKIFEKVQQLQKQVQTLANQNSVLQQQIAAIQQGGGQAPGPGMAPPAGNQPGVQGPAPGPGGPPPQGF